MEVGGRSSRRNTNNHDGRWSKKVALHRWSNASKKAFISSCFYFNSSCASFEPPRRHRLSKLVSKTAGLLKIFRILRMPPRGHEKQKNLTRRMSRWKRRPQSSEGVDVEKVLQLKNEQYGLAGAQVFKNEKKKNRKINTLIIYTYWKISGHFKCRFEQSDLHSRRRRRRRRDFNVGRVYFLLPSAAAVSLAIFFYLPPAPTPLRCYSIARAHNYSFTLMVFIIKIAIIIIIIVRRRLCNGGRMDRRESLMTKRDVIAIITGPLWLYIYICCPVGKRFVSYTSPPPPVLHHGRTYREN